MDGECRCLERCFLCEAAMARSGTGKRITGKQSAVLFWSERAGKPFGQEHPVVLEAYNAGLENLCDQAWAQVKDKETSHDERATGVRSTPGLFVHILKRLLVETRAQRRQDKLVSETYSYRGRKPRA